MLGKLSCTILECQRGSQELCLENPGTIPHEKLDRQALEVKSESSGDPCKDGGDDDDDFDNGHVNQ